MSADSNHWVPQFQRANEKSLPILRWPDLFWNAKTWKTWPKIPKSQVGWELVTLSPKKIRYSKKSTKKQKTRLWIHPRQEVDDFSALGHFLWFPKTKKNFRGSKEPTSFVHLLPAHNKTTQKTVNSRWNFVKFSKLTVFNSLTLPETNSKSPWKLMVPKVKSSKLPSQNGWTSSPRVWGENKKNETT